MYSQDVFFVSIFLRTSLYSFLFFPPFIFFSLLFHSFIFVAFHPLEAFLPHLSFSPFVFMVSSLCFLSCILVFMVDYSLVRTDCPLVSFFFTRLCGLLEIIGRRCPKVGLFVGRNYPFRFVLRFLFPLVHHSIGIAQTLAMSIKGAVRFSKLEMGLSSFKDHRALEVTSPSTPYKAWDICCALKEKDEGRIRNRFQFPSSVKVRILNGDDRACHSYTDEVCFYEANFISGLCFPIHPFLRELFSHLLLAPAQLIPNS